MIRDFIGHCMDNNIILLILSPHTCRLAQLLDVGVFEPLKKAMSTKLAPLINIRVSCILAVVRLVAFVQAHARVFSNENIAPRFHGASISVWNLSWSHSSTITNSGT